MIFQTEKDPSDVVDYSIDWTDTLTETSPADTISSSTWTATKGVTVGSSSISGSITTVMVSGGTAWKYAELVNTIVTAGSRTHNETISLKLLQK